MRKYDWECKSILNELTNAEPNEVGAILKRYFKAKKNRNSNNPTKE